MINGAEVEARTCVFVLVEGATRDCPRLWGSYEWREVTRVVTVDSTILR